MIERRESQEVERLLTGYVSPRDRHQLAYHPSPFGFNKAAKLLRELSYFEHRVLPKFILPLRNIDEYHDKLLERVLAILYEVASRLDPDGGYHEERRKYKKTFDRRAIDLHANYYSSSHEHVRIWLSGRYSLMARILTAAVEGHFSPEAKRFIANRLSRIARLGCGVGCTSK